MHNIKTISITFLAFAILMAALSGCAGGHGAEAGQKAAKPHIIVGTSTQQDVRSMLGEPEDIREGGEGSVWIYTSVSSTEALDRMPFSVAAPDRPLVVYFFEDGTVSRISRRVPAP